MKHPVLPLILVCILAPAAAGAGPTLELGWEADADLPARLQASAEGHHLVLVVPLLIQGGVRASDLDYRCSVVPEGSVQVPLVNRLDLAAALVPPPDGEIVLLDGERLVHLRLAVKDPGTATRGRLYCSPAKDGLPALEPLVSWSRSVRLVLPADGVALAVEDLAAAEATGLRVPLELAGLSELTAVQACLVDARFADTRALTAPEGSPRCSAPATLRAGDLVDLPLPAEALERAGTYAIRYRITAEGIAPHAQELTLTVPDPGLSFTAAASGQALRLGLSAVLCRPLGGLCRPDWVAHAEPVLLLPRGGALAAGDTVSWRVHGVTRIDPDPDLDPVAVRGAAGLRSTEVLADGSLSLAFPSTDLPLRPGIYDVELRVQAGQGEPATHTVRVRIGYSTSVFLGIAVLAVLLGGLLTLLPPILTRQRKRRKRQEGVSEITSSLTDDNEFLRQRLELTSRALQALDSDRWIVNLSNTITAADAAFEPLEEDLAALRHLASRKDALWRDHIATGPPLPESTRARVSQELLEVDRLLAFQSLAGLTDAAETKLHRAADAITAGEGFPGLIERARAVLDRAAPSPNLQATGAPGEAPPGSENLPPAAAAAVTRAGFAAGIQSPLPLLDLELHELIRYHLANFELGGAAPEQLDRVLTCYESIQRHVRAWNQDAAAELRRSVLEELFEQPALALARVRRGLSWPGSEADQLGAIRAVAALQGREPHSGKLCEQAEVRAKELGLWSEGLPVMLVRVHGEQNPTTRLPRVFNARTGNEAVDGSYLLRRKASWHWRAVDAHGVEVAHSTLKVPDWSCFFEHAGAHRVEVVVRLEVDDPIGVLGDVDREPVLLFGQLPLQAVTHPDFKVSTGDLLALLLANLSAASLAALTYASDKGEGLSSLSYHDAWGSPSEVLTLGLMGVAASLAANWLGLSGTSFSDRGRQD